jgi:hypothetical protein
MIACYIDYPCATFGMTKNTADHIGMALLPAPLVLLYAPGIYYVPHKIQGLAGVVLEKVVEFFCLAISSTKMYIGYKD